MEKGVVYLHPLKQRVTQKHELVLGKKVWENDTFIEILKLTAYGLQMETFVVYIETKLSKILEIFLRESFLS